MRRCEPDVCRAKAFRRVGKPERSTSVAGFLRGDGGTRGGITGTIQLEFRRVFWNHHFHHFGARRIFPFHEHTAKHATIMMTLYVLGNFARLASPADCKTKRAAYPVLGMQVECGHRLNVVTQRIPGGYVQRVVNTSGQGHCYPNQCPILAGGAYERVIIPGTGDFGLRTSITIILYEVGSTRL